MTAQPIEANVVLNADNSQYDQAMATSSQSTNALGKSIDSLGAKINSLSKSAGRKLVGVTVADVALITGATAAWSSYEKQMSRLQAQSAILSRNNDQQTRTMKDYTLAVKGLRSEFGTTTSQAAQLVETLSKVTSLHQSRSLGDLSKVFVEMSHATGESSEGLANSLTNLQKIMGTPINVKTTKEYADTFTYLSAQTNTSATGLAEFTAQLAPVGRTIGMNAKEVAGFATAFTRAGAEGTGAASVFTKVAGDISKSLASGSPEIAHYANLIGVTQKQFKQMGGAEQVVEILEAIKNMGRSGANELERLGLEGPRTLRAITAVLPEARRSLNLAEDPRSKGAVDRGFKASMSGVSDEFAKLRAEMEQTAETLASRLGPIFEGFMRGLVKAAGVINDIAEGPLGKFAQVIAAIIAPLASGTGVMLLFAAALFKIAGGFALVRNSGSLGLWEGIRGGSPIVRAADGTYMAADGRSLGTRGAQIAEDPRSSWFQRGLYNTGATGGGLLRGAGEAIRGGWFQGREFADPNFVRPAPRSALSYIAGGLGRTMQFAVTPQFDQMRFDNPAARKVYLDKEAPWASMADRVRLGGFMGQVGLATHQLGRIDTHEQTIRDNPMLTNQERADQLDRIRQIREETQTRLDTAHENERVARESIAAAKEQSEATRQQTKAAGDSTVGLRRFARGLGGLGVGAVGGIYGGTKAGVEALAQTRMGGQAAGMLGVAGMSAFGVQSNTLMMAGVGTMVAPGWGTAIGAAIGAAADMSQANDGVTDSIKKFDDAAVEASTSGSGLAALAKQSEESKKKIQEFDDHIHNLKPFPLFTDTKNFYAASKNLVEGILGDSDVKELEHNHARADKVFKQTEGTLRDLAKAMGVPITGTRGNQLKQLEEFATGRGAQALAKTGIDLQDLIKARSGGGINNVMNYALMLLKASDPDQTFDMRQRMGKTVAGQMMMDSPIAQRAIKQQDNVQAAYKATESLFQGMLARGMSYMDIIRSTERTQHNIGDQNSRPYEIQMAISDQAQRALAMQAPQLGRIGAYVQQQNLTQNLMAIPPNTPIARQRLEQSKQATEQGMADNDQYFRQMLLAQQAYERGRTRAQDAYNLQRSYQEYDYNLQRNRAEESFERQRRRAVADYYRGVRRAHYDFNLQRRHQEEDFNHQVEVMTKQQAVTIFDVYERVNAQRTHSAEYILSNAQDQLIRIQEQAANLDKVRRAGVSDSVIQVLRLDDPQQAQQLARFVAEMTPALANQLNKVAGSARIKAVKQIVTDPSSLEWKEMTRGFNLERTRAAEEFERQMKISRQDFKRGLGVQREEFGIAMAQQAEDHKTGMTRQEHQYKITMDQAAEDMAHMADEVLGSIEDVLETSSRKLTGSAKKQADMALKAFRDLKKDTRPEAIALMKDLASIFGFDYDVPKLSGNSGSSAPQGRNSNSGAPGNITGGGNRAPRTVGNRAPGSGAITGFQGSLSNAAGGVLPGFTPGQDVHQFFSPTGGQLNLSGGEAIMRPEWVRQQGGAPAIDAMNNAAKLGIASFAQGGIPAIGGWKQHVTGYPWARWAGDINVPGPGDYGNPVRAWKDGTVAAVIYLGDRSYGRYIKINHPQTNEQTLYAHLSRASVKGGQQVRRGDVIGNVGDLGNASGPHLHFEIKGGTGPIDLGSSAEVISAATGVTSSVISSVLKDLYPKAEASAAKMKGVHPLFRGDISKIINRFARRKIASLRRSGFASPGDTGLGDYPEAPPAPDNLSGNPNTVHRAMLASGLSDHQWASLYQLVMHESSFNNLAQNPSSSAYGLFQFLDSTWRTVGGHKTDDSWLQSIYGMRYIKKNYGTPNKAWEAWQSRSPHWYRDGAVFDGPQTIGVGEDGPEAVIPLNARGGEFMADVMSNVMDGRNTAPMRGGVNIYNTRVDRSTNFTGAITVQSNDPGELIQKLQARQRVMALSRPSLTGSAA